MDEDVSASLSISINDMVLQITNDFTYLDFTINNNLSLNMVIDKCIDKVAAVMAKLNKRVWDNCQLIKHKLKVFQAFCFMAVKPGQDQADVAWKTSISVVYNVSS